MHMEPGVVDGAKIVLSYATAIGAFGLAGKMIVETVRTGASLPALAARSALATAAVFTFFEIFPHAPVGVSEVHLILGSTLFLILGAGPAALGLAFGLLLQSLVFEPQDLPQYGMNVTTLLVPLFVMGKLAQRIIPARTAYADVTYAQAFSLSTTYQAGIVGWVAFWSIYGNGLTAANLASIGTFGLAYMSVVLIEPLVDLAVLAIAKSMRRLDGTGLIQARVYAAA